MTAAKFEGRVHKLAFFKHLYVKVSRISSVNTRYFRQGSSLGPEKTHAE